MKRNVILLVLVFASLIVNAGQNKLRDNELSFNSRFTRCENRWVAMLLENNIDQYAYGYVYVDPIEGFTFKFEGVFTIDQNGRFVKDGSTNRNNEKLSLRSSKQIFAIINHYHYAELGLPAVPQWLPALSKYTDTLAHDVAWGTFYNQEKDSEYALSYLETAYTLNPHANDVEYQLAYAYTALGLNDRAVEILKGALAHNATDVKLNNALGLALITKGDHKNGFAYIKNAISLCNDMSAKSEMAMQMALIYKKTANTAAYNEWIANANAWAPKDTDVYQQLAMLGSR